MQGHDKLNIALPTFCWCTVGKNHSGLRPASFFYVMSGILMSAIVLTCSKTAGPLLLSFPADCDTRKTVVRQSAWCLWKQFLLSISMTPTWDSHAQNDGESCTCTAGLGRSLPLQHHWALWNHLHEDKYILLSLLGSNVKSSKSSLNQAAPVSLSKLGVLSSTKQSTEILYSA